MTLALIAIASFVSNFFGATTGGVGLIMRPLAIFLGYPVHVVVASANIASIPIRISGLIPFVQRKTSIDWRLGFSLLIPSAIGGLVGAMIALQIPPQMLQRILGMVILAIAAALILNRKKGIEATHIQPSRWRSIAGHSGIFGASIIRTMVGGGGVVMTMILIYLYGKTYLESAALRKVITTGSAVASAVLFFGSGFVDWLFIVVFLVSGSLGAYLGTHYGIKRGEAWVRNLMLVVVVAMGLRLLFL